MVSCGFPGKGWNEYTWGDSRPDHSDRDSFHIPFCPCLVAMVAEGSDLEPKIRTIRQFRDEKLAPTAPGKLFISFYYNYLTGLSKIIGGRDTLIDATRYLVKTASRCIEGLYA